MCQVAVRSTQATCPTVSLYSGIGCNLLSEVYVRSTSDVQYVSDGQHPVADYVADLKVIRRNRVLGGFTVDFNYPIQVNIENLL